jgi:hypothetical protein
MIAGVQADTVGLQEAQIIAGWMIQQKKVPPPHAFCQGLIDQQSVDPMGGLI